MQVGQAVSVSLDHRPHAFCHAAIGRHVEQDRAGIAYERIGPGCDHDGAEQAGGWIHPDPAEQPAEREADDDEYRNCRVGSHMHNSRAEVVVAVRRMMWMVVIAFIRVSMVVVMTAVVIVAMKMFVAAAEQERA